MEMQEFDSKSTCEAAGAKAVELAKKLRNGLERPLAWECLPKYAARPRGAQHEKRRPDS